MIRIERGSGNLQGYQGLRLRYLTWRVRAPRAALVVVHGLGDHAARYDDFAIRAAERGLSTWAFDLRGHGRSDGPRVHAESFEELVADVLAFRGLVRGAVSGDVPLVLFGHSMGGLLAIRTLQVSPRAFSAGVISAPWLAEPRPVPALKKALGRVLLHVAPAARLPNGIDASDISHDPKVVREYTNDPLVQHAITPALYFAARDAQRAARAAPDAVEAHTLFLLAGADRIVSTPAAETFARRIGERAEVEVFPGLYHETWNEADPGPVYRRLFRWVEERLATEAS
ncbi:MAG TPA: lysophospholipase [Longimicrobiales bacterium]|nr:lysophospholipase [Longimicrobiales bacterium]